MNTNRIRYKNNNLKCWSWWRNICRATRGVSASWKWAKGMQVGYVTVRLKQDPIQWHEIFDSVVLWIYQMVLTLLEHIDVFTQKIMEHVSVLMTCKSYDQT